LLAGADEGFNRRVNVCFSRRIQLIDATPFPSNLVCWNDVHMEGYARTWFTPKQNAAIRRAYPQKKIPRYRTNRGQSLALW
jgi:hypothetical protein